ncbi:MAG: ABC transporter substrate-binding protein [Myxococcota bacterium]
MGVHALPDAAADPAEAVDSGQRLLARANHCTISDVAASIERLDDVAIRVRLAPNLIFHDGTRIRAQDVVASIQRIARMDPSSHAAWRLLVLREADSADGPLAVRATGESSLELRSISPELDPIEWLNDPALAIRREGRRSSCGPFRYHEDSSKIVMEAFDRHPRGRPFLDSLSIVASTEQELLELESSELDVVIMPGRRLVTLRLSRGLAASELRADFSEMIERESLARYHLIPGSRPISSLARLTEGGDEDLEESVAPPPLLGLATDLPEHLTVAYDSSSSLERRVAERVQLRLHDHGTRATLLPVEDRAGQFPAGADLVVDVQELPEAPR